MSCLDTMWPNSVQFSSIYLLLEIGVTPLLTPQKPTEVQRIIMA